MKQVPKFLSLAAMALVALSAAVRAAPPDAAPAGAADEARAAAYSFLRGCKAFFLATVDVSDGGEAVPRVRPFGALALWDGAIYIQTGNFKPVYRQLTASPRIEICALKPSGDQWVRIDADAVPDTRREAIAAVLDANPSLRSMYSEDDGRTAVFRLENATATYSSFTAPPSTVSF